MRYFFLILLNALLLGCGFHLQGEMHLSPRLQRLYLETNDPYGQLARNIHEYLKMSHVNLVNDKRSALSVLVILRDDSSQELLSTSPTQQTRQYQLHVTVTFQITDALGKVLIEPETLTETRSITIQSNQVLGSSNEANLFYQQMRNALSYAIMNRIASKEVTRQLMSRHEANGKSHETE